ncbi:hypothetical protein OHA27_21565 [Streptomyces sp. NBC_01619]|uniref:Uncharacterized protein n=1 Tax=Streptomyces pratisoli TaxID=3139917 RepID=A0ACC6QM45_9ACTN|nr:MULTISPECIES: hypothetical protein [unclassified Streptomyces]MCX4512846.1 hypothetical protein [Streptomyces sp. NBC_01619]
MNLKSAKRAGVVLGAVALGTTVLGAPAQADPTAPRPVVAVGSDTTQYVMNGLSSAGSLIGSYDAIGSATIDTRVPAGVCDTVTRPNGSSAGINALNADIADPAVNCIDAARSSRGPNNTSTSDLTWYRFAKDAVTVAVRNDSGLLFHTFTKAELQSIYTCETTVVDGITVNPLIPQAGSGTRTYWAAEMGINATTLPSCVKDTNGGAAVQEHDGGALVNEGDIMPYSIAQYIAQGNGLPGVPDRREAAELLSIDGQDAVVGGVFNAAFPIQREVYNVVETARTGEANIIGAFVGAGSEACNSTVIQQYGFGTLANCGTVAFTGES